MDHGPRDTGSLAVLAADGWVHSTLLSIFYVRSTTNKFLRQIHRRLVLRQIYHEQFFYVRSTVINGLRGGLKEQCPKSIRHVSP